MTSNEIRNPRTGQRMIFRETGPEALCLECFSEPNGVKEPMHAHPQQESRFEVLAGRLHFLVEGEERAAGPGETVTIPAGAIHAFWNSGDEVAHYIQESRPALDSERFFRTLFALAEAGKLDEHGMPAPLALPVLVRSMGRAIRPSRPAWPLLRLSGWALAPAAWARGYTRYDGARQMANTPPASPARSLDRGEIEARLAASRDAYLAILEGLSDADLARPSKNRAWNVGEILSHLAWSLEMVPREVASARRGKGMYNMPRFIRDTGSTFITRRGGRGQTVATLRNRYMRAFDVAIATLRDLSDTDLTLGAKFYGEGFYDVAALFAAQTDHLSEHAVDITLASVAVDGVVSAS